jgi:hypothetical protein
LSSFNTAHRVVVSTLHELPFGKGRKYFHAGGWRNALLGGWQIGSILTLQTGFPITVRSGGPQSNTNNNFSDRPNATGARVALPHGQQDPERFFNTAAFVRQPFGTFGNAGRNTLIGPGLIAWDFSTLKNVLVREGQQLQFRFETFNLPNHPNWGSPSNVLIQAAFGKIRSTRTPMRELQLGLKYIF